MHRNTMQTAILFNQNRTINGFDNMVGIGALHNVNVNGVFILLFFNTGIIVTLVQANLSDVSTGLSNVFDGPFYDYSPQWYNVVGNTIVLKMAIAALMPPIYESMVFA